MRKSIIGSFYTLSACFDKIPLSLEEWKAYNRSQEIYLEIYSNCRKAKIPEIESRISIGDVTPINKFLTERGFDIKLSPIAPQDLAIASILEVLLKWLKEGVKISFPYEKETYSGVDLKAGVQVLRLNGFPNPVASITTKNGDTVLMTIPEIKPSSSFEVFELARKLFSAKGTFDSRYVGVIFPMIDLDTKPDISWILGMSDKKKDKWEITQALQQTIVKMDEKGVLVREAVALGIRCLACDFPETFPLKIDRPFLFVIIRKGLKEPLFSAFLDLDSWKKES